MSLKSFIFNKGTRFGVLMALFYQIMMLGIYFYGYHAVPANIGKLSVEIVNSDGAAGIQFLESLSHGLPYKVSFTDTLNDAQQKLQDRTVGMIIELPKGFLEKKVSTLNFYINQSNPQTTTAAMEGTAKQIIAAINTPRNEIQGEAITANFVYSNKVPHDMSSQMAPMFITLALYVGAMISSVSLSAVFKGGCKVANKWRMFGYLELMGLFLALTASLLNVGMVELFMPKAPDVILRLYVQNLLMYLTAFQLTSIFSILLSNNGMFINAPLLLGQVLASGSTMGYPMLPTPFKVVANVAPIFSNTQINYNILFGGGGTGGYVLRIALIGIVALLIDLCIVFFTPSISAQKSNTDMEQISEKVAAAVGQ